MKAILILLAILAFEQGYCSHDSFTGLNLDKYPCKPEYLRVSKSIVTIVGFISFFGHFDQKTKKSAVIFMQSVFFVQKTGQLIFLFKVTLTKKTKNEKLNEPDIYFHYFLV